MSKLMKILKNIVINKLNKIEYMKKSLIIFRKWILVFVIIIFSIVGKPLAGMLFPENKSFDKLLIQTAGEINKNCLIMVDENTRADNAVALLDNTIQYNYTMINFLKEDVDVNQLKSNVSLYVF